MTTKTVMFWTLWPLLMSFSTAIAGVFNPGEIYHGFKLIEKRFVKEVNAECLCFEHVKSGAQLLKISADDANKTFSIAFKTVPESDCGTPHIMEHSVLNGSVNFPVKSPFDVLNKGSLNTFLNAMTGSEITIYPVASMNEKDYFNLMHVYLDAVLHPLIYEDPRILQQEGWHHELTDQSEPVTYKGVVYNEMKGAFSSPTRELNYQIYRRLFPDNGYGYSAGGHPMAIPELTYQKFLNYHRRYYHPDNSYIFLYGDAGLEKELAFIDANYLSHFVKSESEISIPLQRPFDTMKQDTAYYSVSEDGSTENQTYLSLSFVVGLNTDRALVMGLDVLKDVLVNQESAPVRLALQEASIGREVSAEVDDIQQNVFTITVQNAEAADLGRFRDVVMKTLQSTAEKGLNKQAVEGTLNRLEFRLREGDDAQKGLTYNFQAIPGWFFTGDPFLSLEYEKPLAKVKTALQTDFLESIIRTHLLMNPHVLLLALEPKPGLEKENQAKIDAELAAYKSTLSKAAMDSIIGNTQELVAYQEREDTPEALATIPLLKLSDVNPKSEWYAIAEKKIVGLPILHHEAFTNGVVYVNLYFDARSLPVELIPYTALLAEVLGSLNTKNYSYGDLDNVLNIHTGGFSTQLNSFLQNSDDASLMPKFVVASKAMGNKVNKLFELASEIVNQTLYADKDRLKVVLTRHQSRLDSDIRRNGYRFAVNRLESYYTQQGLFNEMIRGVEYYWFVTDLSNQFDQKADEIIANLTKTASLLFRKENLVTAVTCNGPDAKLFSAGFVNFAKSLKKGKADPMTWNLQGVKKNEGLQTASKVQYVIKGYDFKKLGYQWNGKMFVLSQILSTDWLQNRIRVIGGAYGGFSSFSSSGRAFFASYRDPNLKETLRNYDDTPDYLRQFDADETAMTRYIIGTVANIDQPLTPSERGLRAVQYYFEKKTFSDIQNNRNAVLGTTVADIRGMEKMVRDILSQNAICVYGNEEKIETEKDLFDALVKPIR